MLATVVVAVAGLCLSTVYSSPVRYTENAIGVRQVENLDFDDVHQDHPELAACEPESTCFHTCDRPFKTCLINANTDPEVIEICYRDHSNCLGNTCKCSDADDGAGYPIMSKADTCFILCRTDVLECLSGESRCDSTYPQCMNDCLPEAPKSDNIAEFSTRQSLPACNPETACFHSCDANRRTCLKGALKDEPRLIQCDNEYTACAANSCKCDRTDEETGYNIFGKVGLCMNFAGADYNLCQGASCELQYFAALDKCLPSTLSARQAELPDCDTTTQCFRDCDTASKICLLDAGRDQVRAFRCSQAHNVCAANNCLCDATVDEQGQPIFSIEGWCMTSAWMAYSVCEGIDCEVEYHTALDSCLPTSTLDPRDNMAAKKWFYFYAQEDIQGLAYIIQLENDVCTDMTKYDQQIFVSVGMAPTDYCDFYQKKGCQGAKVTCNGECNLGATANKVLSIDCRWSEFDHPAPQFLWRRAIAEDVQAGPAEGGGMDDNKDLISLPNAKHVMPPGSDPMPNTVEILSATERSILDAEMDWPVRKHFYFYRAKDTGGLAQVLRFGNNKCMSTLMFDSPTWVSAKMAPTDHCLFYPTSDCSGYAGLCDGPCNIGAIRVLSVRCWWIAAKTKRELSNEVHTDLESRISETKTAPADPGYVSRPQVSAEPISRTSDHEVQPDSQASTRTISFSWDLAVTGRRDLIVVENQKCQKIHRGRDWHMMILDGIDENCSIYAGGSCEGNTLIQDCHGLVGGCAWNYEGAETLESISCTFNTKIADPGLVSRAHNIGQLNDRSIDHKPQTELQGPTRTIEFFWGPSPVGRSDWLVVSNGRCQKFSKGKNLHARKLNGADEYCVIYWGGACENNEAITACNGQDGGCSWTYTGTQTLESVYCNFNTAIADPGHKAFHAAKTKQLASRQGLVTKTFEFHTDFNLRGSVVRAVLAKSLCMDLASYDPASFRSLNLRPGESCRLFNARNCGGGSLTCTGGPCNFNRGADKVAAARCDWLGGSQLAARIIPPVAKRQLESPATDLSIITRNIEFNTKEGALGTTIWITVTNNQCQNLGAQHNPAALRLIHLKADESCGLFSKVNCGGAGNICAGTVCNISQVDSSLVAINCTW